MKLPQMDRVQARVIVAWYWLLEHPIALINLFLGLIAVIFFSYLLIQPIDVLKDWTVKTTLQGKNGQLPVYHPGSTLEFISKSDKLIAAEGETNRIFDCDATATQPAREIALDKLRANRAPGSIPPKETSIIIPSVLEFNGLPRICRIIFYITYHDVVLWRDHAETARTNDFIVKEEPLNSATIRQQIDELTERIRQLEGQLQAYEQNKNASQPTVALTPRNQQVSTAPQTIVVQQTPAASPSPSPSPIVATPTPRPCVIGLLGLCILGGM